MLILSHLRRKKRYCVIFRYVVVNCTVSLLYNGLYQWLVECAQIFSDSDSGDEIPKPKSKKNRVLGK